MTTAAAPRMIEFPPGVDGAALLRPLYHSAFRLPGHGPSKEGQPLGGSDYRRAVTRWDPTLFALTYLRHYLRQQDTGQVSFAQFHLDMAEAAKRWIEPVPALDIWVAPRRAAKSTWLFLVLPLWALAHEHRHFFLGFAWNDDQVKVHLANLRTELADNALLLADFPGLKPQRGSNTQRTVLTGGAAFAVRSLGSTALGIRAGTARPDLILVDDGEPDPSKHTAAKKSDVITYLTNSILPMGAPHTVVQVTGTTTMTGSLIHDAVQAAAGEPPAPWLAETGFRCRHYHPFVRDPQTGAETSMWPQAWSTELLQEKRRRAPNLFAMQYANDPSQAEAVGYWKREHFVYDDRLLRHVRDFVLYVDPAMTSNAKSDQTAIVIAGSYGTRAVVAWAEAGRWPGEEIKRKVWDHIVDGAGIRRVIVESNNGGDRVADLIKPLPRAGVKVSTEHVKGSKRSRLEVALGHYQREAVVHARPLTQLEEQAMAWTPAADDDDLLDALAGALRHLFT